MSRIERAKRIRDVVLEKAGLSFEASLAMNGASRIVGNGAWEAKISSVARGYVSMPVAGAGRLDLCVHGTKVAVIAWTENCIWTPHMRRGSWESVHFGQPRYRSSAQRWLDVCNSPPAEGSVLALMPECRPARLSSRTADALLAG